jgi:hypothetical protein
MFHRPRCNTASILRPSSAPCSETPGAIVSELERGPVPQAGDRRTVPEPTSDCSLAQREMPARRLLTREHLDNRTRAARRARELAEALAAELGGNPNVTERAAIDRAATLAAIAEDARTRHLGGDCSITLSDVVQVDNAADRAARRIRSAKSRSVPALTLAEYVRSQGV